MSDNQQTEPCNCYICQTQKEYEKKQREAELQQKYAELEERFRKECQKQMNMCCCSLAGTMACQTCPNRAVQPWWHWYNSPVSPNNIQQQPQGWYCTDCGKTHSPFIDTCPYSNARSTTTQDFTVTKDQE